MIHGWNGDFMGYADSSFTDPNDEFEKRDFEPMFLWRTVSGDDGSQTTYLGDQFLSAFRLFVIAIIFLLSFSIMWRAIDRLGANDNLNEGAISDPTQ